MGVSGHIIPTPAAPDWERAACIGKDTDLFFADDNGPNGFERRMAKGICATCPILRPCLDYALADPRLVGIWGSTTAKQRIDIRAGRRPIPAEVPDA